jgi:hypothetical protein
VKHARFTIAGGEQGLHEARRRMNPWRATNRQSKLRRRRTTRVLRARESPFPTFSFSERALSWAPAAMVIVPLLPSAEPLSAVR